MLAGVHLTLRECLLNFTFISTLRDTSSPCYVVGHIEVPDHSSHELLAIYSYLRWLTRADDGNEMNNRAREKREP